MRPADIQSLTNVVIQSLQDDILSSTGRGLLLCPSEEEIEMATNVLKAWSFDIMDRRTWDLMNPAPAYMMRYDATFMCNMFMYSTDPARWLENLAAKTDFLFMQDSIRCGRMPDCELGNDGDSSRYSFPSAGRWARIDGFDLETFCKLRDMDTFIEFYNDVSSPDGRDCEKFAMRIDMRKL